MLIPTYLVLLPFLGYKVNTLAKLEEVFTWDKLSFAWPSEEVKHAAIQSGDYVPENNLPLGMERWHDKLFFTIPRWKNGVASSLGYISVNDVNNKSPSVIPYPNWKAHAIPKNGIKPGNDGHIVSPFRVAVDACDRLWVLDSRLVDILGDIKVISPPAILIYDLNTDTLIREIILEDKVLKEGPFFVGSFLPNIVIDVNKAQCDDAHAYLSDVSANAIVVYSLKKNKSWKFEHHYFHFDPLQGNFNSGGINFQWNDGVFGLALGPEDQTGFRTIYFHPSASLYEFTVNSSVLKNETLADDPHTYYLFKLLGCRGENSQSTVSILDQESNAIFYTQLNRDGVSCWNPKRSLIPDNVPLIAQHHEKLIFTNEIRIDDKRDLWILSNKMPKFLYDHLNNEEVNYRVLRVNVDDAIRGTACVA